MAVTRERHQHLERTQIELSDQHGRIWLTETEFGRDFYGKPRIVPVGQFHPRFQAPYDFIPPTQFLVYNPRRPSTLQINYAGWQAMQEARHREIKEYLSKLAWSIYKDQAPRFIKDPSPEMLELVYGQNGKGPEPVEPIIAAKQGNGWVLGLRPFDPALPGDVRLKPFLEQWVACRYRHAAVLLDEEANPEMDFTEGQEAEPVLVGDEEEED